MRDSIGAAISPGASDRRVETSKYLRLWSAETGFLQRLGTRGPKSIASYVVGCVTFHFTGVATSCPPPSTLGKFTKTSG